MQYELKNRPTRCAPGRARDTRARSSPTRFTRPAAALAAAAAFALLSACGSLTPGNVPPGSTVAEAVQRNGSPTGDYPLPNGGRRLEYAMGSFGKHTYMLDFDASGRLVRTDQVLDEAHFVQIVPGMPRDEVRMRLGRPAWVFNVPRQHLQVWNYRYFQGDCVWFQVSISDAGAVTEAGYGQDPACDGPRGAKD